jgi:hypothetical protein
MREEICVWILLARYMKRARYRLEKRKISVEEIKGVIKDLREKDFYAFRGCPTITKQPTDNIYCTDIKSSSSSQHPFTL